MTQVLKEISSPQIQQKRRYVPADSAESNVHNLFPHKGKDFEGKKSTPKTRTEHRLPRVISTEWSFQSLFPLGDNDPAIEEEMATIRANTESFVRKWKTGKDGKPRTDYLQDPGIMKKALDDLERYLRSHGVAGKAGYYFHLRSFQDQFNPVLYAKNALITTHAQEIADKMHFFSHNIGMIPPETQQKMIADPRLQKYRHFLEKHFTSQNHSLSKEGEEVLSLTYIPGFSGWINMSSDILSRRLRVVTDEDGNKYATNWRGILFLLNSRSKPVRDEAAVMFNTILANHADIAEYEINAILEYKKNEDRLRGHPRPDSSRQVADEIKPEVVDTLINSVSQRYDIPRRYFRLKSALLGLPRLAYHEVMAEYDSGEKAEAKKYSFQEAVNLVYSSLSKLDPEFGQIMKFLINEGRYDVNSKKGKREGSFSFGADSLRTPTFILLNHSGSMDSVTSLAHETGHGIGIELMRRSQNELNYGVSLATAETASTFMEDFVHDELMRDADEPTRLAIQMKKLDNQISGIFRETACYRFEQELHRTHKKQGFTPKENISSIFQKHMSAYMGDAVEQSPGSENWWVFLPPIRKPFYVYSYPFGHLVSKGLQALVKENPAQIKIFKDIFSAGVSESPQEIFAKAGIDITDSSFWQKGLAQIEKLLEDTEQLARKLGKLPPNYPQSEEKTVFQPQNTLTTSSPLVDIPASR